MNNSFWPFFSTYFPCKFTVSHSHRQMLKSKASLLTSQLTSASLHNLIFNRTITKVRLKWVKNRSLDHIIDVHTDIKAACLIKDAIVRSPTGYLTSRSLSEAQRLLGLTVPTLRFVRRYPTLFEEYPHPKYPSLACVRLSEVGKMMHEMEMRVFEECEGDLVERLCRVLMMTKSRMLPLQSLHPLKWDLGLPDDFDRNLIKRHPDQFRIVKGTNGSDCLKLLRWNEEYTVSTLQKINIKNIEEETVDGNNIFPSYRDFRRGKPLLEFPMSFPRGYGSQKKVKAWMDEFQKLPYISPYEDSSKIDPNSELMEKRVVGVLHEFLSLTVHKKTKRNYLRSLREEVNLPHKFTRIFTRYPGIFYLSLKCKTTTVALREGYRRGRLVDPHRLARYRDKLYYVMRTGLIFRNKAAGMLQNLERAIDDDDDDDDDKENDAGEEESEEEEFEECFGSDDELDSDEEFIYNVCSFEFL